jgi:outer membrane protein assembly factor BamB/tetratricopeptide (TPR) repeat protein
MRHLDEADRAIASAAAGRRELLELVGPVGSGRAVLLDEIEVRAQTAGLSVHRAAGTKADRSRPGRVAELLGVSEEPSEHPVGILVDDAQWVDPTSIGRLQRLVASQERGLLLVLAHEPLAGHLALPLERLAEVADRRGSYVQMALEPLLPADLAPILPDPRAAERIVSLTDGLHDDVVALLDDWTRTGILTRTDGTLRVTGDLPDTWDGSRTLRTRIEELERPSRRLVEAAAVAGRPVPLDAAAVLIDASPEDALDLGEDLVRAGLLAETREGFAPADPLVSDRLAAGLGDVRRARLFRELAAAFDRAGWGERDPGLAGRYHLEAGQWDRALELLSTAALAAVDRGDLGEALPLLDGALAAYEGSAVDDPTLEGRLRLGRARYYRLAGWSDLAAADLELAVRRLEGTEKVSARGFLAAAEDDRQDAQTAEWLVAGAQAEALSLGETAMVGSLLVFQAYELSRLGFAPETDAALAKGKAVLAAEGSAYQRFLSRYNEARIALDRGRARRAEAGFASLVNDAADIEGTASLADKQAWWARALFAVGRPDEALEAAAAAVDNADRSGTSGPVFLTHMARSEGAQRYGRYEQALEAAAAMLGIVLQQLPAWENAARYQRAKALLGLGRVEEASEEAGLALDLCPSGINGWRWRLKIRALQLQLQSARGGEWPQREAEDLTDELLQGNWLDVALELMTVRAASEHDRELARQAAALALEIGIPTAAAEAFHAGDLWTDPAATAVAFAISGVTAHVPPAWSETWTERPEIAAALATGEVSTEEADAATAELRDELNRALAAAGLADPTTTLSPAQRRERGLVRRRPVRRALSRLLAAAVVVVLGGVGTLLVLNVTGVLDEPEPTVITVTVTGPTTPSTIPPEDRPVALPEEPIPGEWITAGGNNGRTGESDRLGIVDEPVGIFWKDEKSSEFVAGPVALGRTVMIGNLDQQFYFYDKVKKESVSPQLTGGPISATAAAARVDNGERVVSMAFVTSGDGRLYVFDVGSGARKESQVLGLVGSPLVQGTVVYVGSENGRIYAFDVFEGSILWQFPAEGEEPLQAITTSPAYSNGILYFGVGNLLYALDTTTREGRVCGSPAAQGPITTPVVAEGLVFVPSTDSFIHTFEEGTCRFVRNYTFGAGANLTIRPAVVDGVLYQPVTQGVLAFFVEPIDGQITPVWNTPGLTQPDGSFVMEPVPAQTDAPASSSPVVAGGVLYVGARDGYLYAFDIETRALLWKFPVGSGAVSTPAVLDGVIYAASFNGTIRAIAGAEFADS